MVTDDIRVLVEMAHMYYEDGATQAEVAKRFNVSRSLVSKYLSRARDMGIVEIVISDERIQPFRHIEERMKREYGLDDVICVEDNDDPEVLVNRLGSAAAKYLSRMMKDDSIIGVAPGRALYAVASSFSMKTLMPDVTFVPLTGGLAQSQNDIQANVISELLSRKIGAQFIHLHAPVMVDSPEARKVFMNQTFIKRVFDIGKQADIAVVGVGGTPAYYEMTSAYLHKIDGPVDVDTEIVQGDICYNFIDKHGHMVECDWNQRVMALSLDAIRNIPMVVAVSGGAEKRMGVYSALAGKLINTLITDVETCRFLLSFKEEE